LNSSSLLKGIVACGTANVYVSARGESLVACGKVAFITTENARRKELDFERILDTCIKVTYDHLWHLPETVKESRLMRSQAPNPMEI